MSDARSMRGTPAPSEAGQRPTRTANEAIQALATHDGTNNLKIGKPDFYYGDRDKYDTWVNQMDMYFLFNKMEDNLKPVFATSFLRGRAQHWVKPFLREYLDTGDVKSGNGIFKSYQHLKVAMKSVFGISNEQSTAVRVIQHLTQKTSTAEYAAKFQEHAQLTDWDDEALQVMYRRGLKENVKDELMRDGRSIDNLGELVQVTIDLDDKLYERAMERRYDSKMSGRAGYISENRHQGNFNNRFNKPNQQQQPYYGPQPMELDVTQRGRKMRGKSSPHKKNAGKLTCYACGKQGHMARNCRGRNMVRREQFNSMQPRSGRGGYDMSNLDDKKNQPRLLGMMARKPQDSHGTLHWRYCYDDSCQIHYSSKMETGYWPSKPLRPAPTPPDSQRTDGYRLLPVPDELRQSEIRSPDHEEGSDQENQTPEESEDEGDELPPTLHEEPEIPETSDESDETSDEEDDEIVTFTVDAPTPIKRLVLAIARASEEVFPKFGGKRLLNPIQFDLMLSHMRFSVWDYPQMETREDFQKIIIERPPIGSIFTPYGYLTPRQNVVTDKMRLSIQRHAHAFGLSQRV